MDTHILRKRIQAQETSKCSHRLLQQHNDRHKGRRYKQRQSYLHRSICQSYPTATLTQQFPPPTSCTISWWKRKTAHGNTLPWSIGQTMIRIKSVSLPMHPQCHGRYAEQRNPKGLSFIHLHYTHSRSRPGGPACRHPHYKPKRGQCGFQMQHALARWFSMWKVMTT